MSGAEHEVDQALIDAALAARQRGHAPYSGYRVGAAVRTSAGHVHTGCNVEIASFSHTCCAERVAIFKAVSEGETELTAVAIATGDSPPATPCGACRQVMQEFADDLPVWLCNPQGEVVRCTLGELLPGAFRADRLLPHMRRRHGQGD